jgi:hypothetical protein
MASAGFDPAGKLVTTYAVPKGQSAPCAGQHRLDGTSVLVSDSAGNVVRKIPDRIASDNGGRGAASIPAASIN